MVSQRTMCVSECYLQLKSCYVPSGANMCRDNSLRGTRSEDAPCLLSENPIHVHMSILRAGLLKQISLRNMVESDPRVQEPAAKQGVREVSLKTTSGEPAGWLAMRPPRVSPPAPQTWARAWLLNGAGRDFSVRKRGKMGGYPGTPPSTKHFLLSHCFVPHSCSCEGSNRSLPNEVPTHEKQRQGVEERETKQVHQSEGSRNPASPHQS